MRDSILLDLILFCLKMLSIEDIQVSSEQKRKSIICFQWLTSQEGEELIKFSSRNQYERHFLRGSSQNLRFKWLVLKITGDLTQHVYVGNGREKQNISTSTFLSEKYLDWIDSVVFRTSICVPLFSPPYHLR